MQFKYRILEEGKVSFGKAEADNEQKLIEHLRSKNKTVLSISPIKQSQVADQLSFLNRIGFNDIVDFTRKIAMMLNAGLTIIDTLDILKKQTTKPSTLKLINKIDDDVRAGSSLSEAIMKHKQHFGNLYIALVQAGEASGKLDEILLKLADNLDKEREFKGKIKGALIYPALVLIAMSIVMFIMITFVIPKLLNLYKDFNIDLPITTKILITVSEFFQLTWPILIVGVVVGVFFARKYSNTPSGKKTIDKLMLRIPIIHQVIRMSSLVDATRTLSVLVASGVSILDSLNIVIDTAGNIVYREAFEQVYKDVEKGKSLGASLDDTGVFPPILVQMTGVGEQTGKLDDTLKRISHYFEMESTMAIKALTAMIEPSILMVLGIFVGVLVMSVISPIYNLTSSF